MWACAKPNARATPEQIRDLLAQCVPYLRAAAPIAQPEEDIEDIEEISADGLAVIFKLADAVRAEATPQPATKGAE